MPPTLLDQGLMLMLVGMGTVFVFLTILVAGMTATARILAWLSPAAEAVAVTDEEVAAITAAITRHRAA